MRRFQWLAVSLIALAILLITEQEVDAKKKRRKRKKKTNTEQVAMSPVDSLRMIHKPGVQNQAALDSLKASKNAEKKKSIIR